MTIVSATVPRPIAPCSQTTAGPCAKVGNRQECRSTAKQTRYEAATVEKTVTEAKHDKAFWVILAAMAYWAPFNTASTFHQVSLQSHTGDRCLWCWIRDIRFPNHSHVAKTVWAPALGGNQWLCHGVCGCRQRVWSMVLQSAPSFHGIVSIRGNHWCCSCLGPVVG